MRIQVVVDELEVEVASQLQFLAGPRPPTSLSPRGTQTCISDTSSPLISPSGADPMSSAGQSWKRARISPAANYRNSGGT